MALDVFRRAAGDQLAAGLAALGTEVDQPVGGADDVEVVLDDDDRVAGLEQLPERAHQLGDVVEVQPGGRLVEHEERAAPGQRLAAGARVLRRLGKEAGELQALRLAAGERRHRLAELHVLEADVDDRLQPTHHLAVVAEQLHRLGDGELEDVGDAQAAGDVAGKPPLDGDVEDLGPEAAAVAVGAAQVDVAQELHLDVLEARAAAGRAAAVAGVEAEHAGAVAALQRQRLEGEQLADLVEGADVARRVGARRLADRALVDEHRVAQPVGAVQRVVRARRLGRLAEVARQRRRQDVLDQRALARARDAGHADQVQQRELDRDALQVVVARAFEDEARGRLADQALQAHADLLARAEVGAGQGVGALHRLGRAVEDDRAAALAGARAHVDQAVGGEHHRRVVLDHDQGVAGVAQAVHRQHDPVHVARMQADRRLVEHEQGVDQRGAERGRQVDALDLAAGERAALPVEREVADADVAEVAQARADLVVQERERVLGRAAARCAQAVEERRAAGRSAAASGRAPSARAGPRAARGASRCRPAGSASPAPAPRRHRPWCRAARAAPRASAGRRRRPGTACSCGTSTAAPGCASCRPSTRGSRRSGGCRTTAGSTCPSSSASPRSPSRAAPR